ncbi:MAG: hypothetical protein ACYS7Y_36375 [Planctomycetota bacterium]|jgi:hypothetical protein
MQYELAQILEDEPEVKWSDIVWLTDERFDLFHNLIDRGVESYLKGAINHIETVKSQYIGHRWLPLLANNQALEILREKLAQVRVERKRRDRNLTT